MRPDLTPFARRLVAARPDLAAAHLKGQVTAQAYTSGVLRIVTAPLLDLRLSPEEEMGLATQLVHGEPFTVYETRFDGLSWGQSGWDGYVGYAATDGLEAPRRVSGELLRVTARSSHIYGRPDIKAAVRTVLPCLAEVATIGTGGGFAELAGGGFVPVAHLAALEGDAVDMARRFLGVPYLWGGRSAAGIDCSGLVQIALTAAGSGGVWRDSDMQEALLGMRLAPDAPAQRGDLVFWKGHVGITTGEGSVIHANAHHMAVSEEPLAAVIARIEASGGGPVTCRRRPPECFTS